MRLNALSLEYFRNYLSARAEFHPGMNIICGDNAQGKTNLLEGSLLSGRGQEPTAPAMTGSLSCSAFSTAF